MKVIGIAGGVASGKSEVAKRLVQHGAHLLDADRAGHEVLREPEVKELIRKRWGNLVFTSQGEVNRAALAQIVFADTPSAPQELSHLESISHPRIAQRLTAILSDLKQQKCVAAVLDAPVMFKAGWDKLCDIVVFVDTTRERRKSWAISRGWTDSELDAREDSQVPLNDKRARSDFVVDNRSSIEALFEQVDRFWNEMVLVEE